MLTATSWFNVTVVDGYTTTTGGGVGVPVIVSNVVDCTVMVRPGEWSDVEGVDEPPQKVVVNIVVVGVMIRLEEWTGAVGVDEPTVVVVNRVSVRVTVAGHEPWAAACSTLKAALVATQMRFFIASWSLRGLESSGDQCRGYLRISRVF